MMYYHHCHGMDCGLLPVPVGHPPAGAHAGRRGGATSGESASGDDEFSNNLKFTKFMPSVNERFQVEPAAAARRVASATHSGCAVPGPEAACGCLTDSTLCHCHWQWWQPLTCQWLPG